VPDWDLVVTTAKLAAPDRTLIYKIVAFHIFYESRK